MKKSRLFLAWLALIFLLNGCSQPSVYGNTNIPTLPSFIEINNKSISVSEINDGLKDAFNTALYYHKDGPIGAFLNKTVEYELFFISDTKTTLQPKISFVITNMEHPLSTEQNPLLYKFSIHATESGLQSYFCEQSYVRSQANNSTSLAENADYLGNYSLYINKVERPKHEAMSSQWKKRAEEALQLYMERNDFYSEKENNLPKGKYSVFIQGFSKSDVDSTVVFAHEDGRVYLGQYYFVHDIHDGEPADLNKVALVESADAHFAEYLARLRENAAVSMEYVVQQ